MVTAIRLPLQTKTDPILPLQINLDTNFIMARISNMYL
jgi:hypothetical protein